MLSFILVIMNVWSIGAISKTRKYLLTPICVAAVSQNKLTATAQELAPMKKRDVGQSLYNDINTRARHRSTRCL